MALHSKPECFSLDAGFRFNVSSEELRVMKNAIARGIALEITAVEGRNDKNEVVPELFVLYFHETYPELLIRARTHLGVDVLIKEQQCITMLGSDHAIMHMIHEVLDAESVIYMIPEVHSSTTITGQYTLLLLVPRK